MSCQHIYIQVVLGSRDPDMINNYVKWLCWPTKSNNHELIQHKHNTLAWIATPITLCYQDDSNIILYELCLYPKWLDKLQSMLFVITYIAQFQLSKHLTYDSTHDCTKHTYLINVVHSPYKLGYDGYHIETHLYVQYSNVWNYWELILWG